MATIEDNTGARDDLLEQKDALKVQLTAHSGQLFRLVMGQVATIMTSLEAASHRDEPRELHTALERLERVGTLYGLESIADSARDATALITEGSTGADVASVVRSISDTVERIAGESPDSGDADSLC